MMRQDYLFDAPFLIALMDRADVDHGRALALVQQIPAAGNVYLADSVINDVTSVITKRAAHARNPLELRQAFATMRALIRSYPLLCLYELLPEHTADIIACMENMAGKFSFHDALIATYLMQEPLLTLVTLNPCFHTGLGLNTLNL